MTAWQRFTILAILGVGLGGTGLNPMQPGIPPAAAAQFEQMEVDQSRYIVLAAPAGDLGYKLMIFEQIQDSRPCWSESGSNPSTVEPLLLTFDFTGICSRAVDSNGYSVRTAGQDLGLEYSLRLVQQGNRLVLIAASNRDRNAQIAIGDTQGLPTGFSRIVLYPGWRLTRRAFNGRQVGHLYLTHDQPMQTLLASAPRLTHSPVAAVPPLPTAPVPPRPAPPASSHAEAVIPVPTLPPTAPNVPVPATLPRTVSTVPRSANAEATGVPSAGPVLSGTLPPPPPPIPASSSSLPANNTGNMGGTASTPRSVVVPTEAASQAASQSVLASSSRASSRASGSSVTASATPVPRSVPQASPAAPVRVPSTSTSNGALLRPRASRSGSSQSPRTTNQPAAPTPAESVAAVPVSVEEAVEDAVYQVIVLAETQDLQNRVKELAPSAFVTTLNGQNVMQAGVFRDRQEADRLQQRLSRAGLPTAVIPVR
ncbi:MAG: DUF3747 domain-containing protein [Synechococcales cyanobacterium M58_A2018_015]|nr:DUF3747 domain-containing protein [Synechococcales cyanobacterium M58_A2018_015]